MLNTQNVSYEELVQRGLELRESKDDTNWELGDLAIMVHSISGPKELKNFSKSIGIPVTTIRRCMDVSKAYEPQIRSEYKFLSWSHFRAVAAQNDKVQWLEKAFDNEWSVEKLNLAVKDMLPVDERRNIPAKPEMIFCEKCGKWAFKYAEDYTNICPRQARCE